MELQDGRVEREEWPPDMWSRMSGDGVGVSMVTTGDAEM